MEGPDDAKRCGELTTYGQMFEDGWIDPLWAEGYEAKAAEPDNLAYPCGAIAKYLFNDRFTWIADVGG